LTILGLSCRAIPHTPDILRVLCILARARSLAGHERGAGVGQGVGTGEGVALGVGWHTKSLAITPALVKVGVRLAASWNRSSRNNLKKVVLIGDLALTKMALGDNAAALTLAERAIAMIPIEKDALTGPRPLDIPARVAVRIGNSERAITTLEKAACDSVRSTARHKPAARPCVAPAAREIGGNAWKRNCV